MADKPFLIEIKSVEDLEAAKRAKAALEAAAKAAKEAGQPTAELEAKLKAVNAAMDSQPAKAVKAAESAKKAGDEFKNLAQGASPVSAALKDLESKFPIVGKAMAFLTNPIGALITSLGALVAVVKTGVHEFAKQEVATVKLHQAMAAWGSLTKENADRYNQLAAELQKTTGIADDDWLAVIKTLTQFGSRPESIGMDVEAVKNLAGLLGGDLNQAAMLWGKALQGQFELFGRYGIVIDQNATQLEKMAKLQAELAVRGGGQLEVMLTTLSGKWTGFKNAVGDALEEVGSVTDRIFNLHDSLDQLIVVAQEGPKVLKGWSDWATNNIPLFGAVMNGLLAEAEGWTKVDNARKKSLTTAAQLEEANKNQKKALDDLKESAKEAATAVQGVLQAQQALQQFQDELSDIDMGIALERLKAQALPEAIRLRAEKDIRARFAREKSDRKAEGFDKQASALEGEVTTAEGAATQAESEAATKKSRADKVAEYEAQQAKADKMQRDLDRDLEQMGKMQDGLRAASPEHVAAAERKLLGDTDIVAKEKEKALRMRRSLGIGEGETAGKLSLEATQAAELAKEKRKIADEIKKTEQPKIDAAKLQAEQERRIQEKREDLFGAQATNEIRKADEDRLKEDRERVKKGKASTFAERFPNVRRPDGEAETRNFEDAAARRAADAALGTRSITPPKSKNGVQEVPVDAVPVSPERSPNYARAQDMSKAADAFAQMAEAVLALANSVISNSGATSQKVREVAESVKTLSSRMEAIKTQVQ